MPLWDNGSGFWKPRPEYSSMYRKTSTKWTPVLIMPFSSHVTSCAGCQGFPWVLQFPLPFHHLMASDYKKTENKSHFSSVQTTSCAVPSHHKANWGGPLHTLKSPVHHVGGSLQCRADSKKHTKIEPFRVITSDSSYVKKLFLTLRYMQRARRTIILQYSVPCT